MTWLHHAAMIGLAGFFGAIARFAIGGLVTAIAPRGFPYGTLVVNLTGCFILAFFLTLIRDRAVSDALRLAVAVGFVGAYTTFSTFAWEVYEMGRSHQTGRAAAYLFMSFAFGIGAVYAGVSLARQFERS
ncbi:MAG: fluoride efflux transporter CrcB [Planctomycetota bacterium]